MNALGLKQFLLDCFSFHSFTSSANFVLRRNLLAVRRALVSSAVSVWGETILLLVAFGYGFGALVPEVQGRSYIQYLMPGLLMSSGMWAAFFEATLGGRWRLFENRTYQALRSSPISTNDILYGEIFWAAFKGILASCSVLIIGFSMDIWGLDAFPALLMSSAVNSLIFSSLGFLMMTSPTSPVSSFNLQVVIILPMYLFSGVLFPPENLASALASFFDSLPLAIAVRVSRDFAYGEWALVTFIWCFWLLIIGFVLLNLAVARLRRLWIT